AWATPSGPNTTVSTALASNRHNSTPSTPCAASSGCATTWAPRAASGWAFAVERFHTFTSWPAARRRRTMAEPIRPRPQNPSFISGVLVGFKRPLGRARVRDRALVGRADQACIFFECAGQALAGIGLPLRLAGGQFFIGDMQLDVAPR